MISTPCATITPATVAVMIEGVQSEKHPACLRRIPAWSRELCDEKNLLLLWDGVQCGHFRTGSFQSFQAILGDQLGICRTPMLGMAKSLGGGFPIGAVWISEEHVDVLGPGTCGCSSAAIWLRP